MKKFATPAILPLIAALMMWGSPANAVVLTLETASTDVLPNTSLFVDLRISDLVAGGAPTVSVFDIDIGFDDTRLSFVNAVLGDGLGLESAFEVFDVSLGEFLPGIVNVAALSLLDANALSGPSGFGPFLDDFQPDSFVLATIEFFIDVLDPGDSAFVEVDSVLSLGDGLGDPLAFDAPMELTVSNNTVVAISEPATLFLLVFGALLLVRRQLAV